jgi:tripartite ATP-independent transporter DctM subunit
MSWEIALLIYATVLFACLLFGVSIGAAMGLVGILGVALASGIQTWNSLGDVIFNTATNFTLASVPLFVLMGEIILRSGMSRVFYAGLATLLAPIRGALAYSNIVGCAIFAALCGSTVATTLTIGTVALPEMRWRGYSDRLTFGSLTGGGCLGILIPPSIPMIIYGSMTNESIIDLFMAGVIPGILLVGLFILFVKARTVISPELVPSETATPSLKEFGLAVLTIAPVISLIILIFSGMYFGLVTPTEAAALGAALALVIGLFYGQMTWLLFWQAVSQTLSVTAIVLFITINAQILSFAVVQAGIGRGVAAAMVSTNLGSFFFFCLLYLFYLVLGMFLDGLSLILLTVPILYPAMVAMGFDGVWLGVMMVVFIELGALTPPMGLNLFALQSISRHSSLAEIGWSSMPYAVIISAFSFLLYFFPNIVLFLPSTIRGN